MVIVASSREELEKVPDGVSVIVRLKPTKWEVWRSKNLPARLAWLHRLFAHKVRPETSQSSLEGRV
jgi:hypothetical protein